MLVIEPVFMNTFISTTYASLPNRGGHKALHKLEYDLRNNDLTYCLKMDIKKFFSLYKQRHIENTFKEEI